MVLLAQCPYCGAQAASKDHLFPRFMGGTRTIPVCKSCNERFGHTFEAKAAELLAKLHIYFTGNGLRLHVPRGRWKRAFVQDGHTYDIEAVDGRLRFVLSDPEVEIDERRVLNARFGSLRQAQQVAASLRKKHGVNAAIETSETPSIMPMVNLSFGREIARLAIKICSGLASTLPEFTPQELFVAEECSPRYVGTATYDFRQHDFLDDRRPPLAHLAYVERTSAGIIGILQIFGSYQYYCRIGPPSASQQPAAALAVLDIVGGTESQEASRTQGISAPPTTLPEPILRAHLAECAARLQAAAIVQGARPFKWSDASL